MRKILFSLPFLVACFILSGCVTPPPVESAGDALGQTVSSIDAAALSVRQAEVSGTITHAQALIAKAKLNQAYAIADKVRQGDPTTNPNDAAAQIHTILSAVLAMIPETKP